MIPSLLAVPDVSVTVMAGVGREFTDIVLDDDDEQLFAFVTVTV